MKLKLINNPKIWRIMTRDEWCMVYMTTKEKERIHAYAEEVGLPFSTAIRSLALKQLRQEEK